MTRIAPWQNQTGRPLWHYAQKQVFVCMATSMSTLSTEKSRSHSENTPCHNDLKLDLPHIIRRHPRCALYLIPTTFLRLWDVVLLRDALCVDVALFHEYAQACTPKCPGWPSLCDAPIVANADGYYGVPVGVFPAGAENEIDEYPLAARRHGRRAWGLKLEAEGQ
jgi:hypothetical protein